MIARGLLIVALLLPRYTAIYERSAAAERADLLIQVKILQDEIDCLEQGVARYNTRVRAWEALRERDIWIRARVEQIDGNRATALIRREKRILERQWAHRPTKKSPTTSQKP